MRGQRSELPERSQAWGGWEETRKEGLIARMCGYSVTQEDTKRIEGWGEERKSCGVLCGVFM